MPNIPRLNSPDENPVQAPIRFRAQLGFLLLLTSIFFINFIARIILAPLTPTLEVDLNLTHGEAGLLFFMISSGYFVALLGSGFFSSHFTHKQTIVCSITAVGLALLFTAFSSGLWGIRLALIALGLASGLYLPSAIASLTATIRFQHWGKAIAIHELAPNLSFVAAPLLAEAVMIWFSWRAVFVVLGVTALLLSVIFSRFSRGGDFCGKAPGFESFRAILSNPSFWILIFLFCLGISGTTGIYTMMPLFLVNEHGMERNWANTLVAISRIAGMAMAFVGGWFTDRVGPKRVLTYVCLLTGGITLVLAVVSRSWVGLPIFLQPAIAVCFFPAGMAALSLISSPGLRNIVVSLTAPLAFLIGAGAVPTLIGFIGDMSSFAVGIGLVGGLILTGALVSQLIKFHDQPEDTK
jgi:NNP family nitrate/nitrite transporter-like MFS transporter